MNNCEVCINSRLVISENGYHVVCTLHEEDMIDCLLNKKQRFEGNSLYLMCVGDNNDQEKSN